MTKFKDIPGYEGLYEAGDDGTIWTVEGKVTVSKLSDGRLRERHWKRRQLKPKTEQRPRSNHHDLRVSLWKNGKYSTKLVARMVALAFIDNPDNKPCINHIDGNSLNNNVSNLEWCTYQENNIHARHHNLNKEHQEVVLVNKNNRESFYFNALAEASVFLGKNKGYVSGKIKQGIYEINEYVLFMPLATPVK